MSLVPFHLVFIVFGGAEHLSKYRMVQHCGQDWNKIKFSFQSIPLHLLVNTQYCSFLRVVRVGSRKKYWTVALSKAEVNHWKTFQDSKSKVVDAWDAGSPVTLGRPHSDCQKHISAPWRQGDVLEGAQAPADPDWVSCPPLILGWPWISYSTSSGKCVILIKPVSMVLTGVKGNEYM